MYKGTTYLPWVIRFCKSNECVLFISLSEVFRETRVYQLVLSSTLIKYCFVIIWNDKNCSIIPGLAVSYGGIKANFFVGIKWRKQNLKVANFLLGTDWSS